MGDMAQLDSSFFSDEILQQNRPSFFIAPPITNFPCGSIAFFPILIMAMMQRRTATDPSGSAKHAEVQHQSRRKIFTENLCRVYFNFTTCIKCKYRRLLSGRLVKMALANYCVSLNRKLVKSGFAPVTFLNPQIRFLRIRADLFPDSHPSFNNEFAGRRLGGLVPCAPEIQFPESFSIKAQIAADCFLFCNKQSRHREVKKLAGGYSMWELFRRTKWNCCSQHSELVGVANGSKESQVLSELPELEDLGPRTKEDKLRAGVPSIINC
jgi:hypothetical protein